MLKSKLNLWRHGKGTTVKKWIAGLLTAFSLLGIPHGAGAQSSIATPTIDKIKHKGLITCGVTDSQFSFAGVDSLGEWTGFDVDFCRAVAAALMGDSKQVRFIQLGTGVRFQALKEKEVDVLFRNTTWTFERDTMTGLDFAGVTFYDGQGFLVPKSLGVTSIKDLKNPTICVVKHTTSYKHLLDYINKNGIKGWAIKTFETFEVGHRAFFSEECNVYTTDLSALYSMRAYYPPNPDDFVLLAETISKEPLGPMVRNDDPIWFDLIKWVVYVVVEAEERGITSKNFEQVAESTLDPTVQFLLGVEPGIGKAFGLDDHWARRVIEQVGNYREIFERNLGPDTPMKMERGLNRPWTEGGLHYAIPVR